MENKILFKIHALIIKSGLSERQQFEFYSILENLKEGDLKNLLDVIEEDDSWVEKLYHNYENKKTALYNDDFQTLRDIIKSEDGVLDSK